MSNVQRSGHTGDRITDTRLPGAVAEIRAAAVTALGAFCPRTAEEAADILLWWRRRSEMTDADVAAAVEAMFPAESERLPQAALSALRVFQPADRDAGRAFLDQFAARGELLLIDIDRILNYYFTGNPATSVRRIVEPMTLRCRFAADGLTCVEHGGIHVEVYEPVPDEPERSEDYCEGYEDGFAAGAAAVARPAVFHCPGRAAAGPGSAPVCGMPDWDHEAHDYPARNDGGFAERFLERQRQHRAESQDGDR